MPTDSLIKKKRRVTVQLRRSGAPLRLIVLVLVEIILVVDVCSASDVTDTHRADMNVSPVLMVQMYILKLR